MLHVYHVYVTSPTATFPLKLQSVKFPTYTDPACSQQIQVCMIGLQRFCGFYCKLEIVWCPQMKHIIEVVSSTKARNQGFLLYQMKIFIKFRLFESEKCMLYQNKPQTLDLKFCFLKQAWLEFEYVQTYIAVSQYVRVACSSCEV